MRKMIKEEAELYMYQRETNLRADRAAYDMLVQHLVGISRDDARRMIRQAIERDAEDFSGAEIEQAVVAGAYTAHSEGKPLDTPHIRDELRATRPLSVVRAEHRAALRDWAEGRTVPAN